MVTWRNVGCFLGLIELRAFLMVFVLLGETCHSLANCFISYRHSNSSLCDKSRRQPNQCKQRLHVLEENANIICHCSDKCPTCNKALGRLKLVYLFLCVEGLFSPFHLTLMCMYVDVEIYLLLMSPPLKHLLWVRLVDHQKNHRRWSSLCRGVPPPSEKNREKIFSEGGGKFVDRLKVKPIGDIDEYKIWHKNVQWEGIKLTSLKFFIELAV